jgi:hypothetical protein
MVNLLIAKTSPRDRKLIKHARTKHAVYALRPIKKYIYVAKKCILRTGLADNFNVKEGVKNEKQFLFAFSVEFLGG